VTRWIVDGMNVIGSRPDGWWHDRPGAMEQLVWLLERFAEQTGDEIEVVFDGRPPARELGEAGTVKVTFASRGGPNAADDDIAQLVRSADDPASLRVVTSDGDLASRVAGAGAEVVGAGAFRRDLDRRGEP
jgi:predicted RNA-binding protein with PIN domain